MSSLSLPAATLLLLLTSSPASQSATDEPGGIQNALSELTGHFDAVQSLLTQKQEIRNLDLLIERARMAASEVGRLDTLLFRARSNLSIYVDLLLDREAESKLWVGEGKSESMMAEMRRGFAEERKEITQLMKREEAMIVDLQARLAVKERDLEGWLAILDRRLGGL